MRKEQFLKDLTFLCSLVLVATLLLGRGKLLGAASLFTFMAEKYTSGEADITGKVKNLDIDWTNGKVNLAYHKSDTIMLRETSRKTIPEDKELCWLLEDETLHVRYIKESLRLFSTLQKELTITLPEDIDLEEVKISSTSGDLLIPSLTAESLSLDVTSGDIDTCASAPATCVNVTSGDISLVLEGDTEDLTISSTSGDIDLKASKVDSARISTTSGDTKVKIRDAGKVKISCVSGDVYSCLEKLSSLDVNTTSGKITAELPSKPGISAKLHTTTGKIKLELPLTQKGSSYVCGDGSAQVELSTLSGNIVLKPVKDE